MDSNPDTTILGQTYKRIIQYSIQDFESPELLERYYVRSDATGKGYVMLLDSMQEYLSIDINVAPGDTVEGVLVASSVGWYAIRSVVVDSVVTLQNNGVSVIRQYIHALYYPPDAPSFAYEAFWQAGIGSSSGPVFIYTFANGFNQLRCVRAQGTYVFSDQLVPPGLPGIPCDCSLSPVGIEELHSAKSAYISPNLSTGQFTLGHSPPAKSIFVYTATGQKVWQGSGNTIDLSAQPPGVYTAVLATERGRQALRLVVVR